MTHRFTFAILAFALTATPVLAQQRPDFSGTWAATKDAPTGIAAAPSAILGQRFALKHEGETLTVVRPIRDLTLAFPFALDGRELRTRVPGPLCQGDAETIETAAWEGNAIVLSVVGSVPPGGGSVNKLSVRRVIRMESPDTLVAEGTMREAGQPKAVATVYKRAAEPLAPPQSRPAQKTAATIKQIEWLAGNWSGTMGSAGTTIAEERWTPPAGGSMLSVARTIRNGVMGSFEFLCIVERDGGLVYQAMPNGRHPPTDFALTSIDAASATFENPAHDFPKMVKYTLKPDGTLEAVVGGPATQKPLIFRFKKQ